MNWPIFLILLIGWFPLLFYTIKLKFDLNSEIEAKKTIHESYHLLSAQHGRRYFEVIDLQKEVQSLKEITNLSPAELQEVIEIYKNPKKISKVLKTKKISSKNVEQELKDSFKDTLDIF